jgi:glycosylphosphatidylinositol transamidase (GPIT) subunit GPI8
MGETYKVFKKTKHIEEEKIIKNIAYYCTKCNYLIDFSNYDNLKDIIKDANRIRYFGNEPAVRRVIRLLNNDNKIKENIHVLMSDKCKERLETLKQNKEDNRVKFKIFKGPHRIVFE